MCDDAIYYNGTQLWTHWDNDVTSNSLNFEFFTYQTNKQIKLQAPKFKFVIYSQSQNNSSVTLTNAELYNYYYKVKKTIMDGLQKHVTSIKSNKNYTDGFTFTTKRNNIYTTVLYNNLLDSPCIRFMIGEKEKSILDTDKVYIPLIEFNSLYLTVLNSFNNYCVMSQQITMLDQFKKYVEVFENKLTDISCKMNNLQLKNEITSDKEFDNISLDDSENDEQPEQTAGSESESEIENNNTNVNITSEQQSDFDSFLNENRDGFELDLPGEADPEKTQKEIVHENFFPVKLLKNDFSNLDLIISNCVSSQLPVDSFVNTVYSTCSVDLFDGIKNSDVYSVNFILSKILKYNIGNYIQKKVELPKSILPIIVKDDKCNQDKIDCVNFLLLSYVYISKVKTDLASISDSNINKNFMLYCLKTITSPFVFTHILDINKDVLVQCITRLYVDLKNNGFFTRYNDNIYNKTKINIDFNVEYLKEQIVKIYDNVQQHKDKMMIEKFFNKNSKLQYKDFDTLNTKYESDIIKKILDIDSGKDVNSTDNIPLNILKKYGIEDLKYNNDVLIKYIKSKHGEFKDIEQIKNINVSVKDIIDKIDINGYPLDVLKALYFWNVNMLPKKITYDEFEKIISNCNLTENELISMILDNNYKTDCNFYNSIQFLNR